MESARMLFISLFALLLSSAVQAQAAEDIKYIQFQDEKTIVLNNGFLIHKDSYGFYQGRLREFFPDLRSREEMKKKNRPSKAKIFQNIPFAYYDLRVGQSNQLVKHDLVDDTETILKSFSNTVCDSAGCVLGTAIGITFDREMNVYYGVTTGTTGSFITTIYKNEQPLFYVPNVYFYNLEPLAVSDSGEVALTYHNTQRTYVIKFNPRTRSFTFYGDRPYEQGANISTYAGVAFDRNGILYYSFMSGNYQNFNILTFFKEFTGLFQETNKLILNLEVNEVGDVYYAVRDLPYNNTAQLKRHDHLTGIISILRSFNPSNSFIGNIASSSSNHIFYQFLSAEGLTLYQEPSIPIANNPSLFYTGPVFEIRDSFAECTVEGVPQYTQNNEIENDWYTNSYAGSESTIGAKGCALTSVAMLASFYQGTPSVNPGELNVFLNTVVPDSSTKRGYTKDGAVIWNAVGDYFAQSPMIFEELIRVHPGNKALVDEKLRYQLCNGNPVIMEVNGISNSNRSHFILGNGIVKINGQRTFKILDPVSSLNNLNLLDQYENNYKGLRFFRRRETFYKAEGLLGNIMVFSNPGVSVTVTSPSGLSLEANEQGDVLNNFLFGNIVTESIEDLDQSNGDQSTPESKLHFISSNESGQYQLKIKAKQSGPFFVEGRLNNNVGEVNGVYRVEGYLADGEEKFYQVSFDPMREGVVVFEENLNPILDLNWLKALGVTLGSKTHLLATSHIDPTEIDQYPTSISEFKIYINGVETIMERWKNSQLYLSQNDQGVKRAWLKDTGDIVVDAHIPKLTQNQHELEFEIEIQEKKFKGILKLKKRGLVYVLE